MSLSKEDVEKIKNHRRAYARAYYHKNKKKIKKRNKFYYQSSKYPKSNKCEFCESKDNLGRHHPDYNYPDIFVTCCKLCHGFITYDEVYANKYA